VAEAENEDNTTKLCHIILSVRINITKNHRMTKNNIEENLDRTEWHLTLKQKIGG
jgi:hypothetical protein